MGRRVGGSAAGTLSYSVPPGFPGPGDTCTAADLPLPLRPLPPSLAAGLQVRQGRFFCGAETVDELSPLFNTWALGSCNMVCEEAVPSSVRLPCL